MKRLYADMKRFQILYLFVLIILFSPTQLRAQVGYYDAPYTRYEADLGTLTGGAAATSRSFDQYQIQSEASGQICVYMNATNSAVEWTTTAAGDGLVVRYCVPDGSTGKLDVYADGVFQTTLTLSTYWSWESLWNNGNSNNNGVSNQAPKMRFDEVRFKLSAQLPACKKLKLVRNSSSADIYLDFAELEPVPAALTVSAGEAQYDGSGLQNFINSHGGQTIFLPAGTYNYGTRLNFDANNTTLKGAGSWYTEIHFTSGNTNDGGVWGRATNISYSGIYFTTDRNSRSSSYKCINGVYTSGSTIKDVWAIHFECGAWIANYEGIGPGYADGFKMSYCRFRNNYADGSNLCRGTSNAIVEHCNYRNNGDDDMGIWPQSGSVENSNNIFRYCTSENTWRSAGVAIYGGYNNQAYNILIQDNVEVGIKVNNAFGGYAFNGGGTHTLSNIIIKRCGTDLDLFNTPVGAIEIGSYDRGAGTYVQNVKFSCIQIFDSKDDAIDIHKVDASAGGFTNVVFENITVNGTGLKGGSGYSLYIGGNPPGGSGNTYCNMSYSNGGGSSSGAVNTSGKGSMSWNAGSCSGGCTLTTCPYACSVTSCSATNMTSGTYFGPCSSPIALTATTTAPGSATVSYIEYFVDGVSIGQDNSSPYSVNWNTPTAGSHSVYAVAHYSDGTTSTSGTQTVTVSSETTNMIYPTSTAPNVTDGVIDALWANYPSYAINNVSIGAAKISGAADLSAYFKIIKDATNMYILVDVTDDVLQGYNAADNSYDNDEVELFFDMGNEKASSYDGNDHSYNFMVGSTISPGTGITFKQGSKTGGYFFEMSIPFSTLGSTPSAGSSIGFDVGVDDDDDGGARDSKIDWSATTDVAWTNPSVFGTLQIASCPSSLPIELLSFTGEYNAGIVNLNWITATEINNQKFVIQRSANTLDWETIGTERGAGNSSSMLNYSYTDYSILSGTSYYRLQQVDFDGKSSYSNVVVIQPPKQGIVVAPNPFDDALTITTGKGAMTITIYDITGHTVYQASHKNEKENNGYIIQPNLAAGTYIISIQTDSEVIQQKIIRQ